YSRALIDYRSLFRNQVHPVEDRVHQQHVIGPVRGHRPVNVLPEIEPSWLPISFAESRVDAIDRRVNKVQVLPVSVDVLAGRLKKSPERDLTAIFGMVLEQPFIGQEPAYQILRRVSAIHSN